MHSKLSLVFFFFCFIAGCQTSVNKLNDNKKTITEISTQKHSSLLTNHATRSVALQLVNLNIDGPLKSSSSQLYEAVISNDYGKSDKYPSPIIQIIAEKEVFDEARVLLFVFSSYLNSLELEMSRIVLLQSNYTSQEIAIIDNNKIRDVVVIPIDFNRSHDHLVRQFSTVLHEMTHIEGAYFSRFIKKPAAITFREEYEAYKMGVCFNFWVNAFQNQTIERDKLTNAKIELNEVKDFEIYNRTAAHLKVLSEYPGNFLISAQAKSLVIENFNLFNFDFCNTVVNDERMYEQLKMLLDQELEITPNIQLFKSNQRKSKKSKK
jgi:hypothetical protein